MPRKKEQPAWTWVHDEGDDVHVLSYDVQGSKLNILTASTLDELQLRLDELEESSATALVIESGKPAGFIAGADVGAIASIESEEDGVASAAAGQEALRRLSTLGIPSVVAVHGACVGGGAELACWCDGRVLTTDDKTRIGFPEVKLGIIPGFGGTQRLPGIVGLEQAVTLATSGRLLAAKAAKRIGLADVIVSAPYLRPAALAHARKLAESGSPRKRRRAFDLPILRDQLVRIAGKKIAKATGGHYPAPAEALRLCRLALDVSLDEGLAEEARTCGRLLATSTSQNLLHVYDLGRESQADGVAPPKDGLVGVLGAGIMGGGIAGVAIAKGYRARMRDVAPEPLAVGVRGARDVVAGALRRSHRRRLSVERAEDRLSYSLWLQGFAGADLAVEAVVEVLEIKKRVLAEVEEAVGEDCIIATNTSSFSVSKLATALERPDRFIGMHFFNPVARMPLVEIIRGPDTSDETVARVVGWTKALGKYPVVVGDSPGFLVNRILMPYLDEALKLQDEGCSIVDVDRAAKAFGMPMGPFRLLDEVGIDVAAKVAATFAAEYPERYEESVLLSTMAEEGRLGQKSGGGFYDKSKKHPPWKGLKAPTLALPRQDIEDRLVLRMADEAMRCLQENVVRNARGVDLATVMGMGFPPFRGGLCRYVHECGAEDLVARMDELKASHGSRFTASKRFRNVAAGKKLY